MAAKDKVESIIRMMESDQDGEALNALRLLRRMAKAENKNLAEFLMSGAERVVYRDRPQQEQRGGYDWAAAARRAAEEEVRRREARERQKQDAWEARQRARAEREEEEAQSKRERYGGAFDDAEMTDEERAAARARRAERKANGKRNRFHGTRELLDALAAAYEEADDDDLTPWEADFASTIPYQYSYDWDLSDRQKEQAERIIRKVERNKKGSPI